MSAGYFEHWANSIAYTPTPADRALAQTVLEQARLVLGTANLQWAGSHAKHIAIRGSDLDLFVLTPSEVTQDQRRKLAEALRKTTVREVRILHHAIRISGTPPADICFEKAHFGHRSAPEVDEFQACPARQQAARALKFWCNRDGMPSMKGWVAEAVVVHLDPNKNLKGWDLFLRILKWFDESANRPAMESILRPVCQTDWKEAWTQEIPGYIEALRNDARRLRKRLEQRALSSSADLEAAICNRKV